MGQLQVQWDRIRRRWVLILIITLVAGAGALAASVVQGTSYTGRAALTIQSAERSPEQDSVLAQGYADFFNQPASQEVLRQKAGLPDGMTYAARVAAGSPIVYIEATGKDSAQAGDAATKMAVTFRDDVKDNLSSGALRDLQGQLAQTQGALDRLPTGAARAPLESQLSDLRSRIGDIEKDTQSNQLQDLQLNAGVAANSSNIPRNVGAGLFGGFVVALLVALALGRFENRIVTPSEIQDRLGLETLAVVGGGARREKGRRDEQLSQRLRALINLVGSTAIPVPGSVAVTSPRPSPAKSQVAISLAALRARQGHSTLLILADLENADGTTDLAGHAGVADFLAGQPGKRLDGKVVGDGQHLLVCPPGSVGSAPTYELFSRGQLIDLLRQGRQLADLIVVDAPSVIDSPEAQIVCSVVDRTVLVVEEGETKSADGNSAVESLRYAQATVMGAVIVQNSNQFGDLGLLSEKQWRDVTVPAGPPARVAPPTRAGVRQGAPAAGAIEAMPADRTAPISRGDLERARAAAGLPASPGDGSGPSASAQGGTSTPKPAPQPTNGSARPTPGHRRPRADDAPPQAGGSAPGSSASEPSSSTSSAQAGAPGSSPSAPAGGPSPRPTNGSPTNGSPVNGSSAAGGGATGSPANGSPRKGATPPAGPSSSSPSSSPRPTPGRTPRPSPSGSPAESEAKSPQGPKPTPGAAPAGGPKPPQGPPAPGASPAQGAPGTAKSTPGSPKPAPGAASNPRPGTPDPSSYGTRGSGAPTASPSPKPKPSPAATGAAGAGSASSKAPGEKKIGRVKFPTADRSKQSGTGGDNDRASTAAPTVSLRREG